MKITSFNIVLIGSGNVATQLGLSLKSANHKIVQVYSKQKKNALQLAKLFNCTAINDFKAITNTADIYIIAVNDDAIATVVNQLKLKDKIVAHTSGSVDMNVLKSVSKNYGVFYPLQTISKNKKTDFKNVPICLEANNEATLGKLKLLANSISKNINNINSLQRKHIHLAAVFACNFSNHLYTIAEALLKKNKMQLNLLYPLIEETAKKIKESSPSKNQTGPAKRGDKKVMQEHIKLLGNNKDLIALYKLMSKQIEKK